MDIRFGDMRPDAADLLNGGLEDALNVVPKRDTYEPFVEPAFDTGSLSATCVGAVALRDTSGNTYRFAGTPQNLYRLSATVWTNVSRTASYTTATDLRWKFAVFGNTVLAVNGVDTMQSYTLGTSTVFTNMSASASAPIAANIITVRDFAMAGSIATQKNKVQWSRINNVARWGASIQFQSDSQSLPGDSALIQGMTGGDYAAIFTISSIWRGTYVGSPIVFRFDEVAPGIGCPVPGSIARYQAFNYFWAGDGFYAFDGIQAVPIGNDKVDDFFQADFMSTYKYNVSSVIDPINKLYIISYPSVNSATGICDRLLVINYTNGRWARVEQNLEFIYNALSLGYTLEGLDAVSASIDALPFSLDSSVWTGGDPSLSGFGTNHRGLVFAGMTYKDAQLITGELQLIPNKRAFVRAIRPLIQGNSSTAIVVNIGKRDRQTDSVTWTADSSINSNGVCPVRANARYHRLKMRVTGGFEKAMGFDIDAVPDGMR